MTRLMGPIAAALMALLASPAAAKAYGDGGLVSRLPHS